MEGKISCWLSFLNILYWYHVGSFIIFVSFYFVKIMLSHYFIVFYYIAFFAVKLWLIDTLVFPVLPTFLSSVHTQSHTYIYLSNNHGWFVHYFSPFFILVSLKFPKCTLELKPSQGSVQTSLTTGFCWSTLQEANLNFSPLGNKVSHYSMSMFALSSFPFDGVHEMWKHFLGSSRVGYIYMYVKIKRKWV